MSNHTPGRWNWHTSNSWRRLCSEQERGRQIPVLTPTVNPRDGHAELDVSEADMRLIAAAPDLLEACKALICGGSPAAWHLAEAAIEKAEGGQ